MLKNFRSVLLFATLLFLSACPGLDVPLTAPTRLVVKAGGAVITGDKSGADITELSTTSVSDASVGFFDDSISLGTSQGQRRWHRHAHSKQSPKILSAEKTCKFKSWAHLANKPALTPA